MPRGRPKHDDILTPREWEVLELLRRGLSNQQIADALEISERGARYHVSEIISKLGVGSRHEAAAWQPASRRRWAPYLLWNAAGRMAAAGTIAVAVAALAILAAGLYLMKERQQDPNPTEIVAAETSEGSSIFSGAPLPAPADILRRGAAVSYRVCTEFEPWRRPPLTAMSRVWQDTRVGDGALPAAPLYVLYLTKFYYNGVPTSNSVGREATAFSGFAIEGQPPSQVYDCDYAPSFALLTGNSGGAPYQGLNLIDHRITGLRALDDDLLVLVEDAPGTAQFVKMPDPATPQFFRQGKPFRSVQVIDAGGTLLYRSTLPNGAVPFELAQYDVDGALTAAAFDPNADVSLHDLKVGIGGASFSLYGGGQGQPTIAGRVPAGQITVLDSAGSKVIERHFDRQNSQWQDLASFELPAGSYELRIKLDEAVRLARFALMRDDQPLP